MSFTKIFISERGFISPRSALVLVFLIFSLVTASALQAKPNKPVQTKKSPLIEAAMIMYEDELSVAGCTGTFDTLTIVGANLMPDDGSETTVTLATYAPLTLCAATIEELIVALPPNSAPGDYLLSVATADGVATYDLTVGAAGPQGLKGDKGDKCDKGELPEPQFPVLSSCPCWAGQTLVDLVDQLDVWYALDEPNVGPNCIKNEWEVVVTWAREGGGDSPADSYTFIGAGPTQGGNSTKCEFQRNVGGSAEIVEYTLSDGATFALCRAESASVQALVAACQATGSD